MFNGRYVGTHMIKTRVKDKYALTINDEDIKNHIYDAVRAIGHTSAYVLEATDGQEGHRDPIAVKNYRGLLPGNIEYPLMARDYDTKTPMLCASSIFDSREMANIPESNLTYTLNYHHILTNKEEHKVELAYLGFPTDDNGDPLVPDHEEYIAAVAAYVASIKATNMFMKSQLGEGKLYKVEQDWYAYANGVVSIEMPNHDEMQSIMNEWLGLLPRGNQHSNSFLTHQNQRVIKKF